MHLVVINGPNLNMLGIREPAIYGSKSYAALCKLIEQKAQALDITVECFQSNHEGALIDKIQEAYGTADGIVINPGGYTHTSVALLDALKAVGLPTVEVHISDVDARETFRQISYVGMYAQKRFAGYGFEGYCMAMEYLREELGEKR